ncbi:Lrp/AsnC family transcriptional regulator [Pedobacter sp. PWIIR3]
MNNKVDGVDAKILEWLQKDAKMSAKAIGEIICLSPGAVSKRIRKMERSKVIVGYSLILDKTKLLKSFAVLVMVTLKVKSEKVHQEIEDRVNAFPEVIQSYCIGGGVDYIIHCAVSDMPAYEIFNAKLTAAIPFKSINSFVVIQELKKVPTIDLSHIDS